MFIFHSFLKEGIWRPTVQMQSSGNQPKPAPQVHNATASPSVISALPIAVEGVPDTVELANMSIGQLLGHGQRRVSVTHVTTVAPVKVLQFEYYFSFS